MNAGLMGTRGEHVQYKTEKEEPNVMEGGISPAFCLPIKLSLYSKDFVSTLYYGLGPGGRHSPWSSVGV